MNKTLAREWASYRENVVPATAGPVQAQECKRAFYAGAASMFGLMGGPADANHPLWLELHAFEADVEAGRA